MNKLDITKTVATFIVGAGTTKIVSDMIKNNTNLISDGSVIGDAKRLYNTASVAAAAFVVGAIASDATKEYTGSKIDEAAAWYTKTFKSTEA